MVCLGISIIEVSCSKPLACDSRVLSFWVELVASSLPSAVISPCGLRAIAECRGTEFTLFALKGSVNLLIILLYLSLFPRAEMVIPPPVRPDRVTKFLKPYVLRMHFTNKYVNAQVVHTPTATVAASASTQEKGLRLAMVESKENTRDVAAAAKIGKLLGERLQAKGVPAISVFFKREQRYHGKVKAVIDSVREAGIELV
ncbi:hypothetical protein CQW23_16848 [Capsicum baccatum]|nr:hypothetical protein CQW23_16848 [Capsicum baccatum]